MKHYFDFNNSFDNSLKSPLKLKLERQEKNAAYVDQIDVQEGIGMTSQNYKEMDQIKDLLKGYRQYLINENENEIGKSIFAHDVLEGGHVSLGHAVKNLYNAMRYSIAFGAKGKNIEDDFLSDDMDIQKKATQSVKDAILKAMPLTPENLVDTLLENYRTTRSQHMQTLEVAYDYEKWPDRKKQIEFIKENIDATTTITQRFKAVLSEVKTSWRDSQPLTYKGNMEALVMGTLELGANIIMTPLMVLDGAVKTLVGESGEMKITDAVDEIAKKLENLGQKINSFIPSTKKEILQNIPSMRSNFNQPENKNKLLKDF